MKRLLPVFLCLLFAITPLISYAAAKTPVKKELSVKSIAKMNTCVVLLNVYDKNKKLKTVGSGFIASADGKIITNYHVIDGGYSIEAVMYNNKKYTVSGIVNYDSSRDIAVLKINSQKPFGFITLADSSKAELGESIVAIGSPLGQQNTVSTGVVNSMGANLVRKTKGCIDIQISASISSMCSGGVLFNMYGEAIGVTDAGPKYPGGENLNFAIPINEVKPYMQNKTIPISLFSKSFDKTGNFTKIILYSRIENEYKILYDLGKDIYNMQNYFYLATTAYCLDQSLALFDTALNSTNALIDFSKSELSSVTELQTEAASFGIDLTDMNTILQNYNDALERYKKAHSGFYSYKDTSSQEDKNNYLDNLKAASGKSGEGQGKANSGYTKYRLLIMDYEG